MRLYAILIYIFLYAPIAFIVGGSFNAGKQAMIWQGFSLEWYGKAFSNPLITEALTTSLIIALTTAVLSAIIGTLAALGLERMSGWIRNVFDALIYIAILVPGIVIGISTLIAFVSFFDMVNPYLDERLEHPHRNGRLDRGRRPRAVQHRGGRASRARTVAGHGPQPGRSLGRSLRHTIGNFPPNRAAIADTFHPGGLPAGLHFFVRGFHHHVLRGRPKRDIADICLFLNSPWRHPGNQRGRHSRAADLAYSAHRRAADFAARKPNAENLGRDMRNPVAAFALGDVEGLVGALEELLDLVVGAHQG